MARSSAVSTFDIVIYTVYIYTIRCSFFACQARDLQALALGLVEGESVDIPVEALARCESKTSPKQNQWKERDWGMCGRQQHKLVIVYQYIYIYVCPNLANSDFDVQV